MIARIIARICRLKDEKNIRERRFITRDILIRLLVRLDQFTQQKVNLHVAFCLAFATFLRCEKFTYIVRQTVASDFAD
jgi:hypothetical protein